MENGRLESIQEKITRLKNESKDPNFTEYLIKMQGVLDKQCASAEYLSQEIDKNYQKYLQVWGEKPTEPDAEQVVEQPEQESTNVEEVHVETQPEEIQPEVTHVEETKPQSAPVPQPTPAPQVQPVPQPQMAQQSAAPQVQSGPLPQKKKNTLEFKVGASLFCVIGVLFILVAFVMMGITYMDGMLKGLSLYLIATLLILVSEFMLRKKMEKFSLGITGLGICGLYAATIVNCTFLHNFNGLIAVILTVLISVIAVFIGYKKDSGIFKVISFLGGFICIWPVGAYGTDMDFAIVTLVLLTVNVVSLLLPVKKHAVAVCYTQLFANLLFIAPFVLCARYSGIDPRLCSLCVLCSLMIIGLVSNSLRKIYQAKKNAGLYADETEYAIWYSIVLFFETLLYIACMNFVSEDVWIVSEMPEVWHHGLIALYLVPCIIVFFLFRKSYVKWIQYYAAIIFAWLAYVISGNELENVVCVLAIFVISKLLSRVRALRVSELIITAYTMLACFVHMETEGWYGFALVSTFALSILALHHYKFIYQMAITLVITSFAAFRLGGISLMPAACMGILFLLLLIFNNVPAWRSKYQKVYNVINLGYMGIWCIVAMFVGDYLNCIIMTLLGTAVIVLMFREKYNMNFKLKYLLLSLYWTFMALNSGIETAVITSSLIMVVAIVSVIMGFALDRKEVRVYGLIVSILTSLKVMFLDFKETPIMERMLLFLIVGVIILAISGIYIVLEKKMSDRSEM